MIIGEQDFKTGNKLLVIHDFYYRELENDMKEVIKKDSKEAELVILIDEKENYFYQGKKITKKELLTLRLNKTKEFKKIRLKELKNEF